MRYYELVEAREDFIADKLGDKIMRAYNADTGDKPEYKGPIQVVKHLMQASPKAAQWLANEYIAGNYKLEDVSQVKVDLTLFNKAKAKLPVENRDLNKVSLFDIRKILAPFANQDLSSNKQKIKQKKKSFFDNGEAKLFYKSPTMLIVIPKTKEASCHFGKGTKWCTAATKSDNLFNKYHDQGSLYTVMMKDGSKYQFHFEKQEFNNAINEPIEVESLVVKYPELLDAFNGVATEHLYLPLIKHQTEEQCLAAVMDDGQELKYVRHQTPKICLAAVTENGWALEHVNHQTPKICLAAVTKNGYTLEHVKHQTPELCLAAVTENGWALENVKEQTPELCLRVVTKNGWILEHVNHQTPKICLAAVTENGWALKHVREQTPTICLAAVTNNGQALKYVRDEFKTPEIIKAAKK